MFKKPQIQSRLSHPDSTEFTPSLGNTLSQTTSTHAQSTFTIKSSHDNDDRPYLISRVKDTSSANTSYTSNNPSNTLYTTPKIFSKQTHANKPVNHHHHQANAVLESKVNANDRLPRFWADLDPKKVENLKRIIPQNMHESTDGSSENELDQMINGRSEVKTILASASWKKKKSKCKTQNEIMKENLSLNNLSDLDYQKDQDYYKLRLGMEGRANTMTNLEYSCNALDAYNRIINSMENIVDEIVEMPFVREGNQVIIHEEEFYKLSPYPKLIIPDRSKADDAPFVDSYKI